MAEDAQTTPSELQATGGASGRRGPPLAKLTNDGLYRRELERVAAKQQREEARRDELRGREMDGVTFTPRTNAERPRYLTQQPAAASAKARQQAAAERLNAEAAHRADKGFWPVFDPHTPGVKGFHTASVGGDRGPPPPSGPLKELPPKKPLADYAAARKAAIERSAALRKAHHGL